MIFKVLSTILGAPWTAAAWTMLGAPVIAVVLAAVIVMLDVRPSPRAWKIANAAFSVGAVLWGALIGYVAIVASVLWNGPRAPSQALILLSILIGPAVALAGIVLAWLGLAKRRMGLTLAGPVVTATAPIAYVVMLVILSSGTV